MDARRHWLQQGVQFVKFGVVGISNTAISYGVYVVLVALGVSYLLANGIAFVASVLNSFFWNRRYVFSDNAGEIAWYVVLIKTFVAYSVTGIFLSSILLFFWIDVSGVSSYIAPLINLIITVPLNFFINKYWAFSNGGR